MTSILNENAVELAALEILEELGYQSINGPDIAFDGIYPERKTYQDVVLINRLKKAINKFNLEIPQIAKEEALKKVLRTNTPDLCK